LLGTSLGSAYTIFDRNVAFPRNLLDNTQDTITRLWVVPHREVFAHCLLVGLPKKSHNFHKDSTQVIVWSCRRYRETHCGELFDG
jgi:hypothetical protein